MTRIEADQNDPAAAVADQDLLDACVAASLALDMIRQNLPVETSDDDAADKLDRYHQALERVGATPARTAIGRRMKANVALGALQSVAGDLQPKERCGLSALVDLLSADEPSGNYPLGEAVVISAEAP
jgi:hypothetical protein